jgi:hypothetical protein
MYEWQSSLLVGAGMAPLAVAARNLVTAEGVWRCREADITPGGQTHLDELSERMNGRIQEILQQTRFASAKELEATLMRYLAAYNHQSINAPWRTVLPCKPSRNGNSKNQVASDSCRFMIRRVLIILRTLFFMLQRREHFRDSAVDYEALSVQRNAPRWIKTLSKFGFLTPANA